MSKKKVFLVLFLIIFSLLLSFSVFGAAISNDLHLNIQLYNDSGSVETGTWEFQFNISSTSDCETIALTNTTNLTTNPAGVVSYYLPAPLDYGTQYWLCMYRNGTLKSNGKIARTPATFDAQNISASGIKDDSHLSIPNYNITAQYFKGNIDWSYVQNKPKLGNSSAEIQAIYYPTLSTYANLSDVTAIGTVYTLLSTYANSSDTTTLSTMYTTLSTYLNTTDLSYIPDTNTNWLINTTLFTNASGTLNFKDGGLRLTESQITDLQTYLTSESDAIAIALFGTYANTSNVYTLLSTYANSTDVGSGTMWTINTTDFENQSGTLGLNYTNLNDLYLEDGTKIGNSSDEIKAIYYPTLNTYVNTSDLSYTVDTDNNWPINTTLFTNASGTLNFKDGGLRITESQITDLQAYLTSESDSAAIALLSTYVNSSDITSDLYTTLSTYVNTSDLAYIPDTNTNWIINTTDFENTSGTLELNHTSLAALFLEEGTKIGNSSAEIQAVTYNTAAEIQAIYYPTLNTYANSTDLSSYMLIGSENQTLVSYNNITDIPTCTGTTKLTFDGTTLSCAADVEGEPGATYDLNVTGDTGDIAIENGEVLNFEGGAGITTAASSSKVTITAVNTDTLWTINTTAFANASGTLNLLDGAIRITESQITDLGSYLTSETDSTAIGLLSTYVNTTDLAYIPDTLWVINTTVFENQSGTLGLKDSGIRITESQIIDLGSYLESESDTIAIAQLATYANTSDVYILLDTYVNTTDLTYTVDTDNNWPINTTLFTNNSGTLNFKDGGLRLTESQITDFGTYLTSYEETDPVAYTILSTYSNTSDIYVLLDTYVNSSDLSYTVDTDNNWPINTTVFANASGTLNLVDSGIIITESQISDLGSYLTIETDAIAIGLLSTYVNTTDLAYTVDTDNNWPINTTLFTNASGTLNFKDGGLRITESQITDLGSYLESESDLIASALFTTYANTSDVYILLDTYVNTTDLAYIPDTNTNWVINTTLFTNNSGTLNFKDGGLRITESQITDLQAYLTSESDSIAIGLLSTYVNTTDLTYTVDTDNNWPINTTLFTNASGTLNFKDGGLRLTESQITDLQAYLTSETDATAIAQLATYANTSDVYVLLDTYVNTTDIVTDTNTNWVINTTLFTNNSGTLNFKDGGLRITESQITDLQAYLTSETDAIAIALLSTYANTSDLSYTVDTNTNWPINTTLFTNASGTLNFKDTGLKLTESQITDLQGYLTSETDVTAIGLLSTYANSTDVTSDIYTTLSTYVNTSDLSYTVDTNTNWVINTTLFTNDSGTLNFKDGGLRITESQITDLQGYLTAETDTAAIALFSTYMNTSDIYPLLSTYANSSDTTTLAIMYTTLQTYANTTDLLTQATVWNEMANYVNASGGTFTGGVTFDTTITVGAGLLSSGDVDTNITIATSNIMELYAGGTKLIELDGSGSGNATTYIMDVVCNAAETTCWKTYIDGAGNLITEQG